MFTYKKKDLETQCKNSYAYTATPAHHILSLAASAICYFGSNTNQIPPQAHSADTLCTGAGENDTVFEGLCYELDMYLDKLQMLHIRCAPQEGLQTNPTLVGGSQPANPEVCDPIRY